MSDGANYVFGEISAVTGSAQRATPDQLVQLASGIWRGVTASRVAKDDHAGNDAMLAQLQTEHADFNQSFPLVLRWMVQMRQFNAEAFKQYLYKHASAKLDSREDFLTLQAEYLVLLYRKTHSHPDEKFVRQYRESLVAQLLEEDRVFLEMQRQVEADLAAQAELIDSDRRKRLYEYILAQKVANESVATLAQPQGGGADQL